MLCGLKLPASAHAAGATGHRPAHRKALPRHHRQARTRILPRQKSLPHQKTLPRQRMKIFSSLMSRDGYEGL